MPTVKKAPNLFVLLDSDNKPVGEPRTNEREAYVDRAEFREAGLNMKVQKYIPEGEGR